MAGRVKTEDCRTPDEQTSLATSGEQKEYKDEVLGRRVCILFDNESDASSEFYPGYISSFKMDIDEEGGPPKIQHFVKFDDGDEIWCDLVEEEKSGRLKWPLTDDVKKRSPPTSQVVTPRKKKVRFLTHESDDQDDVEVSSQDDQKVASVPAQVPNLSPLFMPSSIDEIIHYMDELEPDQDYYERQQDSRGGCSGTRGKLRKFAKKEPDHPAVNHWVETKQWEPPNAASLHALIELIKTMIK